MTSFVFDTNCLISAHLLPNSVAWQAYDKAQREGILLYSLETLHELTEVFNRSKFDKYIPLRDRIIALSRYSDRGYLIEVDLMIDLCRDPKDNKFLELALSGNADFIVTGDKDLLVLNPFQNTPIISPSDYVRNY